MGLGSRELFAQRVRVRSHIKTAMGMVLVAAFVSAYQSCAKYEIAPLEAPSERPTFSIKVNNYCPSADRRFSHIYAFNFNAVIDENTYQDFTLDRDGDGLSDQWEYYSGAAFNVSHTLRDTNGNGFDDLVTVTSGFLEAQQVAFLDSRCPSDFSGLNFGRDTDRDLVDDCGEDLLQYEFDNPDTDRDGIPDGLELRFGLSPKDSADGVGDTDLDGLSVIEEIQANTPPKVQNSVRLSSMTLQYLVDEFETPAPDTDGDGIPDGPPSPPCYNILISNIPVMFIHNQATPFINRIQIMATELPLNLNATGVNAIMRLSQATVEVPQILQPKTRVNLDGLTYQTVNVYDGTINGVPQPILLEDGSQDSGNRSGY